MMGMGNELWQLITQSDGITKGVYFIMLSLSIMCWTVFMGKSILFFVKKRQIRRVMSQLVGVDSLESLVARSSFFEQTYVGHVIAKLLASVRLLLQTHVEGERGISTQQVIDLMQQHIDKAVDVLIQDEESLLPVLSVSAAVSPLLGLFGTVWGLIHAFLRINETQMADIATIAPGIAEALMTTLAGLVVAIPALVMFNGLQLNMRGMEQCIESVSDMVRGLLQKHIISKGELYAPIGSSVSQKQTHAQ